MSSIRTASTDTPGSLVSEAGQVQYGRMLLGAGTSAGWRELVGWRDLPELDVDDEPRAQGHGAYPGRTLAGSNTTTFTFLLRGRPEDKLADLATLEAHTQPDGTERPLVVHDGDGPSLRWARVIGRTIPQGRHFRHEPLECSVQWRAADPRRYSTTEATVTVGLSGSTGGITYPETYPLEYGESFSGDATVTHAGTADAPVAVTFVGPLTDPALVSDRGWTVALDTELAAGETITVDTRTGTVLLDGTADRLYALRATSTPLGAVTLPPGATSLALTGEGTGTAVLTFRHAYL